MGCEDYDGSGTSANPYVTQSSFDVSCDLDGNLLVDPLVGVDIYVSFDANSGGTAPAITSPKCLLQEGTTFPTAPVTLQLLKAVTNDSGGAATANDWTLSAGHVNGVNSLAGISGISNNNLPSGDYALSESGVSGYSLDSILCNGGSYDASTSILSMEPTDSVVCTFNNNDNPVSTPTAQLTLIKSVVNDDGGTAVPDDFELAIDATPTTSGLAVLVNAGVDLIVSEQSLPSYTDGTWSCIDSTGLTTGLPLSGLANGTTINLAVGANVNCTIVNNDSNTSQEVDLSVIKSVNNINPSIGSVITFTMQINNAGPDTATDVILTDVLPSGFSYIVGSIAGGDTMQDSDPHGGGLVWNINSIVAGGATSVTFDAEVMVP